jgi:hypothetical protein
MRGALEGDRLVALESFEDLTIIWVVHLRKDVIFWPFGSHALTCLYTPSQGLRLDTEVRQRIGRLLSSRRFDLSGRRIAYKANVLATRVNFCQCIAEPGRLRNTSRCYSEPIEKKYLHDNFDNPDVPEMISGGVT